MRWQGLLALALCGVLLSIALIDAETQLIPNRLNAAVAVLAVLNLLLSLPGGPGRSSAWCASACRCCCSTWRSPARSAAGTSS